MFWWGFLAGLISFPVLCIVLSELILFVLITLFRRGKE